MSAKEETVTLGGASSQQPEHELPLRPLELTVPAASHQDQDDGSERSGYEGSDSDSSTADSTSTYAYSHEPYKTFQEKAHALASSLGDFGIILLERLRGGSSNRVVIARLKCKAGGSVDGVFRIPRFPEITPSPEANEAVNDEDGQGIDCNILDQAAVLQFLQSRAIPVPKLLAFDASADNAIDSPYTLQTCSPGVPLHKIYESTSVQQKLSVSDAVVDVLLSAERTAFSRCGYLRMAQDSQRQAKASYLFESSGAELAVQVGDLSLVSQDAPPNSLSNFLAMNLQHWHEREVTFGNINPVTTMWKGLCELVPEMQAHGMFDFANERSASITDTILYHWDLEPRNILVKKAGASWLIDMVIDWDQVLAVPVVLARKPPIWLWDFCDEFAHSSLASDYDGDVDLYPPGRYDVSSGRLSVEDQQLRQRFEDRFIDGLAQICDGYSREAYDEEAYGKGRWVRRVARFAMYGASSSTDLTRFERLDRDWSAFIGGSKTTDTSEPVEDDLIEL